MGNVSIIAKLGYTVLLLLLAASIAHAAPPRSKLLPDDVYEGKDYGYGWVDWIGENVIVVNDSQFKVEKDTLLYNVHEVPVDSGYFQPEMWVYFVVDSNFKLLLIKEEAFNDDDGDLKQRMEPAGPSKEDEGETSPPESSPDLYQEEGVWKN